MKTQIEKMLEILNQYDAKIWKENRIYINKGVDKTAKVFIEFEKPKSIEYKNLMENAYLRVISKCESQSEKWNINRAKQIKLRFMNVLKELGIIDCQIPEDWKDVIL